MSRQQVLVIGLGQFGMALAQALARQGAEVIAVDQRQERVQAAAETIDEVVVLDAMDEAALARLRPAARDLCVCAIGGEHREGSIVVTALLHQMGAPRIVARATDPMHERILALVGAHEILNPERIVGEQLATRLANRGVHSVLPLGEDLAIVEVSPPPPALGRTLAELALPRRHQLNVLAVRRTQAGGGARLLLPSAELRLASGDVLVVAGPRGAAEAYAGEA